MLEAAHRGYGYQDLLVAARLVDVLLDVATRVAVDKKLVPEDRFDDLTTWLADGSRERIQVKFRNRPARLPLTTFTRDKRDLQLDTLVLCAVADRAREPGVEDVSYRIILGDARPSDGRLSRVLRAPERDPGPFLAGMHTVRLQFDADALWPENGGATVSPDPFAFLRDGRMARADLVWLCERLVIEVEAPEASFDLTQPGPAEQLLIDRALNEIGAGMYPNEARTAVDVASRLIGLAASARMAAGEVGAAEILRRVHIRHDFGAVARAHPVMAQVEVKRPDPVAKIVEKVTLAADLSVPALVIGPPGHGKSWTCHQMVEQLATEGWLVAEHYCFLGDADRERNERVLAEAMVGSLLARLAAADPSVVTGNRPRFAADEQALMDAVRIARENGPDRRVALVVDGLDHATRVRGATTGRQEPSRVLAEELAALSLPPGSTVVVLSQPGDHLDPLREADAQEIHLPGFTPDELHHLAERLGVLGELSTTPVDAADHTSVASFMDALASRSGGNALYATYLCREVLREPTAAIDAAAAVWSFPDFDGTLEAYYRHLMSAAEGEAGPVADILALIDFSVTRAELRQMLPNLALRLNAALDVLAPVLSERVGQRGLRIYHESFARFLRKSWQAEPAAMQAVLRRITDWLEQTGLFTDARAFRFLLPMIAQTDRPQEVLSLVGTDFVARSVAAGFTAAPIVANLTTAVECAAGTGAWEAIVRCIELARAAETYAEERLGSTVVEFSDVPIALLGPEVFVDRLLFEGLPTMPAEPGLLLCSRLDAMGISPPWREYLDALEQERQQADQDQVLGARDKDPDLEEALLRGWLATEIVPLASSPRVGSAEGEGREVVPRILAMIREREIHASDAIDAVWDALGPEVAKDVAAQAPEPETYLLAVAERLHRDPAPGATDEVRAWAARVVASRVPAGTVHRLFALGISPQEIVPAGEDQRARLLELAQSVQAHGIQYHLAPLAGWLDACAIAARCDLRGLAAAEILIDRDGWYFCWLRFTAALARAEALPTGEQASAAIQALKLLTDDLRPFAGDPRACDLHLIRHAIDATIRRALALVDDEGWPTAVAILQRVCDETSVTIEGELSGPLARDRFLALVVGGTSGPPRRAVGEAAITAALRDDVHSRFFTDIARYHLAAARLAFTFDDRERAEREWRAACELLVAYGFHKDLTIYELLESMPALIGADARRAQSALARVQPLCRRARIHTDKKETWGASRHWWRALAAADPDALARLITPTLLRDCNQVNVELEEAVAALWRAQHASANPVVAGALRLTLENGLEEEDPALLERLVEAQHRKASPWLGRLFNLVLSRADERPLSYAVSNSDDLLRRDDWLLDRVNAVSRRSGGPSVLPAAAGPRQAAAAPQRGPVRNQATLPELLGSTIIEPFAPGPVGLGQAARAWRRRPYDAMGHHWSTDRFANAIGYRLCELVELQQLPEAEAAIHALADAVNFSGADLLCHIAEGLEARGATSLAVLAHALTWTRTRGGRGWFTFGGETGLESLRRAAALDPEATLRVLGGEVARRLQRDGADYGMTQALVMALSGVDFSRALESASTAMAFAAWNAAADVIAARLPLVAESDDGDLRYTPTTEVAGQGSDSPLQPVDQALAVATVSAIAHPGRERKRRALLATQVLLSLRGEVVTEGVRLALECIPDSATLSWVLSILDRAGKTAAPIVPQLAAELRSLVSAPHLTVRALARRVLQTVAPLPELPAPDEPAAELIHTELAATPDDQESWIERVKANPTERAQYIVRRSAGCRVARAERVVPGLSVAAVRLLAESLEVQEHRERLHRQLEALASRSEEHFPDAFLVTQQLCEDVVQRVAAGARAARTAAGDILSDPVVWEDGLARLLLNDPGLALDLEAARIPRPDLTPPPGFEAEVWRAAKRVAGQPGERALTPSAVAAWSTGEALFATVSIRPGSEAPPANEPWRGWSVIAAAEQRWIPPERHPPRSSLAASRIMAAELRSPGDRLGLDRPPLAGGDVRGWWGQTPIDGPEVLPKRTHPLVAIDCQGPALADVEAGLGLAHLPLVPIAQLVGFLALQPGQAPFELEDEHGPALVLQTWRSSYLVSDHELPRPQLEGIRLLLRDDLFARLRDEMGPLLVWRDFVRGDAALAGETVSELRRAAPRCPGYR